MKNKKISILKAAIAGVFLFSFSACSLNKEASMFQGAPFQVVKLDRSLESGFQKVDRQDFQHFQGRPLGEILQAGEISFVLLESFKGAYFHCADPERFPQWQVDCKQRVGKDGALYFALEKRLSKMRFPVDVE